MCIFLLNRSSLKRLKVNEDVNPFVRPMYSISTKKRFVSPLNILMSDDFPFPFFHKDSFFFIDFQFLSFSLQTFNSTPDSSRE